MNATAKKLVVAAAVVAVALLGVAGPADAQRVESAKTVWCC